MSSKRKPKPKPKPKPIPEPPVANSRALIISCNYPNITGLQLYGCWSDADLFQNYILSIDPSCNLVRMKDASFNDTFWSQNPIITYLTHFPSSNNVYNRLDEFVAGKEKIKYLYLSGHGALCNDAYKDELNTVDASSNFVPLIPNTQTVLAKENKTPYNCIFVTNKFGVLDTTYILDNFIYEKLKNLNSEQTCYIFTDICHSATAVDLPYTCVADFTNSWPDISNVILTATDISNILTTYSTNAGFNILYEMRNGYDDSVKAKIVHFGATRTDNYAFESNVKIDQSGNRASHGHYTWANNRLLTYGANKLTLRQYFTCLTALINDKNQIPLVSTSQKNVLDISGYLNTLNNPIATEVRSISAEELLNNERISTNFQLSRSRGFNRRV